jgi:hypothetical protein
LIGAEALTYFLGVLMFYVVSHKNGNVRAIVNADNADAAYATFRAARIAEGVNPIKSNHTVDAITLPIVGAAVMLKNTKQD